MATTEYLTNNSVRRSWYLYDWANSAFSTTVITLFLGPYLTSIAESAADASGLINLWGVSMRPGSLFPYVISFSVFDIFTYNKERGRRWKTSKEGVHYVNINGYFLSPS